MLCLVLRSAAGQVQVLSDHIEKLMMFLKHEATQKAKAHEQQRRLQKELELVKVRRILSLPHSSRSRQRCFWCLRVYDQTRSVSTPLGRE